MSFLLAAAAYKVALFVP